jgi:hypothetical protein
MAQARKEPRFAEMEVLTPVRPAGGSARLSVVDADISDADFETVRPPLAQAGLEKARNNAPADIAAGLGLLRHKVVTEPSATITDERLSPGFITITLILAIAVFWLCGGHALLY